MLVRDVMSAPAVTVHPDASLKEVTLLLDEHRVTALPVVDAHLRIVGVISEADVVRESVPADPWASPLQQGHLGSYLKRVGDVMSFHPVTVVPDTELAVAADLLVSSAIKSLPVIEHGVVVGMVSRRDIIAVLARRDFEIAAELRDLIGEAGDAWDVEVVDGAVKVVGAETDAEREVVRVLAGTVPGVTGLQFA
jgi:CBS-domain-containing membrane protein